MTGLSRTLEHARDRYDVIVVGSGYGGGVSASRLARAGKSVAVLERGREVLAGGFPSRFPDLKNEMQVTGKKLRTGPSSALYDVRLGEDMHVLVGCGLGGGSLINAGVALRPDDRVFEDPCWPDEVARDGLLDEGFRRARLWLNPQADPRADSFTKYRTLQSAGAALGHSIVRPTITVSFEPQTNVVGVEQPGCTRCGDCCGGCNVGAKNSVALTYLPDAVRHGAELFTHAGVRYVRKQPDGTWTVHVRRLDRKDDTQEIVLCADVVILSAGTLGTSEILLRSRAQGLALSDRAGASFSANGDIIAFGYGAREPVNAVGVGHPAKLEGVEIGAAVSGQLEIDDDSVLANELRVQEGVLPSAIAPVLPVLFLPNGRLLGALQSLVNGVYKGSFARLQTFFAVSHDSASGRFVLDDDRLSLRWPDAKSEPVYARLDEILSRVVAQSGGSYVKNPLSGTVMGHQPATAHPLGGAGMGRDSGAGVINHKGQVFDTGAGHGAADVHAGLYVVDGSVMPRSLGVNPLLTITALAERTLLLMQQDFGLSFDAEPLQGVRATPQDLSPFLAA
ncbi:GMC family oxidoreductase N-terminal domain-containing protein [Hyphomicrobium sp. D-2]|uniref:GMC family oxidoreductase N-terminal domain-containing protein n=1 Tax=Hyphomicrobium sp. D-2 TaxID=3041621 RepID=UPI00245809C0|nr:GMC family oxidoreductase N-terminal domain-containing protein [Hyphomicrobium sp. D-2]MDH4983582.1 GMC family oxidoreductase N-terminal domain-containing protein [Hyphomicrobium sp. D-2]